MVPALECLLAEDVSRGCRILTIPAAGDESRSCSYRKRKEQCSAIHDELTFQIGSIGAVTWRLAPIESSYRCCFDHSATQTNFALVQNGRLARGYRPLRLAKREFEAITVNRTHDAFGVRLPISCLGGKTCSCDGGTSAIQAQFAGRQPVGLCSHGWSWPCTTHSVFESMSLRATNQASPEESFTPPMPTPLRCPSV